MKLIHMWMFQMLRIFIYNTCFNWEVFSEKLLFSKQANEISARLKSGQIK